MFERIKADTKKNQDRRGADERDASEEEKRADPKSQFGVPALPHPTKCIGRISGRPPAARCRCVGCTVPLQFIEREAGKGLVGHPPTPLILRGDRSWLKSTDHNSPYKLGRQTQRSRTAWIGLDPLIRHSHDRRAAAALGAELALRS